MPATSRDDIGRMKVPPSTSPCSPSCTPKTSNPAASPARTTARTAAFIPAESPPLVRTASLAGVGTELMNDCPFQWSAASPREHSRTWQPQKLKCPHSFRLAHDVLGRQLARYIFRQSPGGEDRQQRDAGHDEERVLQRASPGVLVDRHRLLHLLRRGRGRAEHASQLVIGHE